MRTISFLTEAGAQVGLGHLTRMITFSNLLKGKANINCYIKTEWEQIPDRFAVNFDKIIPIRSETEIEDHLGEGEILIIDGYTFNIAYLNTLRNKMGLKFVVIADIQALVPDCDILVNHLPWAHELPYFGVKIGKRFLGPRYAILREEFYARSTVPSKDNWLICMGGSDASAIITHLCNQLMKLGTKANRMVILSGNKVEGISEEIRQYYGVPAEKVKELIAESSLCIITPGSISYEVFSVGRPAVCGYIVEGQKDVCNRFSQIGLSVNAGNWKTISAEQLSNFIREAAQTTSVQQKLFEKFDYKEIISDILN